MENPRFSYHRRSIRLQGYGYSRAGAYFVTICTDGKKRILGSILDGNMMLNSLGEMVWTIWNEIATRREGVKLDHFVVMPNHVHGIVMLNDADVGAGPRACPSCSIATPRGQARGPAPTVSLPGLVQWFKSLTTGKYRAAGEEFWGLPRARRLWQRNYYEHVIRDDQSLDRIREYICTNPARWESDRENPERQTNDEFDVWLADFKCRPKGPGTMPK